MAELVDGGDVGARCCDDDVGVDAIAIVSWRAFPRMHGGVVASSGRSLWLDPSPSRPGARRARVGGLHVTHGTGACGWQRGVAAGTGQCQRS
jgi:hypothetical protein